MLTSPPGFEDVFPDSVLRWDLITKTVREVFKVYNYKEIIVPVLEYTEVFSRGIGNETDIVSKEMFSFNDRGGRGLTLRPEGTASVVRAYVGNGNYNRLSNSKLFYIGPMFRAERPQKGRLRQFNQFGCESFGSDNPFYDYEIISMMHTISSRLDINDYSLLINSIGCLECRVDYITELKEYYRNRVNNLCDDCMKRFDRNPLRILDCKKGECVSLKLGAPKILSYICDNCRNHYNQLKELLNMNNIDYIEEPYLVRGLDYYTKTTFEFVSDRLGGQNAFAAGGRYDNLVEVFGGKPTPAVGFAAGIERINLLIEDNSVIADSLDIFIVYSGDLGYRRALDLAGMFRVHNISVDMDPGSRGFKSQFKKADRENARLAIIIGEGELAEDSCTVKDMKTGNQEQVHIDNVLNHVIAFLNVTAM